MYTELNVKWVNGTRCFVSLGEDKRGGEWRRRAVLGNLPKEAAKRPDKLTDDARVSFRAKEGRKKRMVLAVNSCMYGGLPFLFIVGFIY